MDKKRKLTEADVTNMVYNSVKQLLKESLTHRTYMEGKPQNLFDELKGNGWGGNIVEKANGQLVLRVYKKSDAIFSNGDDSLSLEELVEDVKIYYQDKGKNVSVSSTYDYNGQEGAFLIIKSMR